MLQEHNLVGKTPREYLIYCGCCSIASLAHKLQAHDFGSSWLRFSFYTAYFRLPRAKFLGWAAQYPKNKISTPAMKILFQGAAPAFSSLARPGLLQNPVVHALGTLPGRSLWASNDIWVGNLLHLHCTEQLQLQLPLRPSAGICQLQCHHPAPNFLLALFCWI